MSDLENLMDATLDDLADLPEFKPFVAGAHKVSATMTAKEIASKPAVELAFKLVETVELAEPNTPEDEQSKPGDEANTVFFLDNEIGQGMFKNTLATFREALGMEGETNGSIVEAVTDVECVVLTGIRVDKKTDRAYLDLKELQIV